MQCRGGAPGAVLSLGLLFARHADVKPFKRTPGACVSLSRSSVCLQDQKVGFRRLFGFRRFVHLSFQRSAARSSRKPALSLGKPSNGVRANAKHQPKCLYRVGRSRSSAAPSLDPSRGADDALGRITTP